VYQYVSNGGVLAMELGSNNSCLHVVGTNHAYLQLRAEPRQVADVIECQQNFTKLCNH
jgi:hypothetical protein